MTAPGRSAGSGSGILRLLTNASWLLSSNVVVLALAFTQGIVLARALGPTQFGTVTLLTTFVLAVSQLVDSRSWEATIKFVSRFRAAGDHERAKATIKASLLLDAATSTAGVLVLLGLSGLAATLLLDDATLAPLLRILSISLLLNAPVGTGLAVLRMDDRFLRAGSHGVLVASLRLGGILVALVSGLGLGGIVLAFLAADAIGLVFLAIIARPSLHRLGLARPWSADLRILREDRRPMIRFLVLTNGGAMLKLLQRQGDVLFVGLLLGPAAAGYYRIARSTADLISAPAQPLVNAAYPEFAKLDHAGEPGRLRALALRVTLAASLIGIAGAAVLLVAGDRIIALTAGPEFLLATQALPWLAGAVAIATATTILHPLLLATGKPQTSLLALALGVAVQFTILALLAPQGGLAIAGIAYLACYVVWAAVCLRGAYAESKPSRSPAG